MKGVGGNMGAGGALVGSWWVCVKFLRWTVGLVLVIRIVRQPFGAKDGWRRVADGWHWVCCCFERVCSCRLLLEPGGLAPNLTEHMVCWVAGCPSLRQST